MNLNQNAAATHRSTAGQRLLARVHRPLKGTVFHGMRCQGFFQVQLNTDDFPKVVFYELAFNLGVFEPTRRPLNSRFFGRSALDKEKSIIAQNVKEKPGKGHVALLVRDEHAQKFCEGVKSMEIRNWAVKFLQPGDCILLVGVLKGQRQAVAILQFGGTIKIEDSEFQDHVGSHCVNEETYTAMKSKWKNSDHCFGWKFSLLHKFERPLKFTRKYPGTEVWLYFTVDCLSFDGRPPEQVADRGQSQDERWPAAYWAETFLGVVGKDVAGFQASGNRESPLATKPQFRFYLSPFTLCFSMFFPVFCLPFFQISHTLVVSGTCNSVHRQRCPYACFGTAGREKQDL